MGIWTHRIDIVGITITKNLSNMLIINIKSVTTILALTYIIIVQQMRNIFPKVNFTEI